MPESAVLRFQLSNASSEVGKQDLLAVAGALGCYPVAMGPRLSPFLWSKAASGPALCSG